MFKLLNIACVYLSVQATDKDWTQMQGKFLLNDSPSKVIVYLEGPPAGTDILLNTLVIKHAARTPPSSPPDFEVRLSLLLK
jgi:hypothetical protein